LAFISTNKIGTLGAKC